MEVNWDERPWVKAHPEALSGCWLWHGALNAHGYGRATIGGATGLAHRAAYAAAHGDPGSLVVRHTCDVRACVNPDHLRLGTQLDNIQDTVDRGRTPAGERSGTCRLTEAQVIELREMAAAGVHYNELAARYGVARSTVASAALGWKWRHLPNAVAPRKAASR